MLSALQLNLKWGLWSYGVGLVGTIWHQFSASHICSFVVSPASLCPPAATNDTLPAASDFPGKLPGCLQPSCLLLPATQLLLWLPRRLLPLKHGSCMLETPIHTGNLNTVLQRHTICWTVRRCLGYDRYGCEGWFFFFNIFIRKRK